MPLITGSSGQGYYYPGLNNNITAGVFREVTIGSLSASLAPLPGIIKVFVSGTSPNQNLYYVTDDGNVHTVSAGSNSGSFSTLNVTGNGIVSGSLDFPTSQPYHIRSVNSDLILSSSAGSKVVVSGNIVLIVPDTTISLKESFANTVTVVGAPINGVGLAITNNGATSGFSIYASSDGVANFTTRGGGAAATIQGILKNFSANAFSWLNRGAIWSPADGKFKFGVGSSAINTLGAVLDASVDGILKFRNAADTTSAIVQTSEFTISGSTLSSVSGPLILSGATSVYVSGSGILSASGIVLYGSAGTILGNFFVTSGQSVTLSSNNIFNSNFIFTIDNATRITSNVTGKFIAATNSSLTTGSYINFTKANEVGRHTLSFESPDQLTGSSLTYNILSGGLLSSGAVGVSASLNFTNTDKNYHIGSVNSDLILSSSSRSIIFISGALVVGAGSALGTSSSISLGAIALKYNSSNVSVDFVDSATLQSSRGIQASSVSAATFTSTGAGISITNNNSVTQPLILSASSGLITISGALDLPDSRRNYHIRSVNSDLILSSSTSKIFMSAGLVVSGNFGITNLAVNVAGNALNTGFYTDGTYINTIVNGTAVSQFRASGVQLIYNSISVTRAGNATIFGSGGALILSSSAESKTVSSGALNVVGAIGNYSLTSQDSNLILSSTLGSTVYVSASLTTQSNTVVSGNLYIGGQLLTTGGASFFTSSIVTTSSIAITDGGSGLNYSIKATDRDLILSSSAGDVTISGGFTVKTQTSTPYSIRTIAVPMILSGGGDDGIGGGAKIILSGTSRFLSTMNTSTIVCNGNIFIASPISWDTSGNKLSITNPASVQGLMYISNGAAALSGVFLDVNEHGYLGIRNVGIGGGVSTSIVHLKFGVSGTITAPSSSLILSSSAGSVICASGSLKLYQVASASLPVGSDTLSGSIVWVTDTKCFAGYGSTGWVRILTGSF